MAPKRNAKRASVPAPAEEPPAKKLAPVLKKYGVTQSSYKQVAETVSHPLAGDLPEDCRKMLLALLPHSICVPSDERDEFQTVAVDMLGEVVAKILAGLQVALDQETEKVAGVEASKAGLDQKQEAAEVAETDAQAATAAREAELRTASEAVVAAKNELTKREAEQKEGDAGLVKAQAEKGTLEAAFAEAFLKLKTGDCEEAQAKTLYQALELPMQMISMDQSLKTAAQGVLTKKPEDRGPFDSTVIDELDKSFQAKIEELAALLDSGKPDSDAREAAVAEAKAALEAAEATQKEVSNAVLSAKEVQKECAAAVKAAKTAVAEYKPEFKAATELRDAKQQELQAFTDEAMATFGQLKERFSAKKQRELAAAAKAAEAEAKAAEEAAAAAEAEGKAAEEAAAAAAEAPAAQEAAEAAPAAESGLEDAGVEVEAAAA